MRSKIYQKVQKTGQRCKQEFAHEHEVNIVVVVRAQAKESQQTDNRDPGVRDEKGGKVEEGLSGDSLDSFCLVLLTLRTKGSFSDTPVNRSSDVKVNDDIVDHMDVPRTGISANIQVAKESSIQHPGPRSFSLCKPRLAPMAAVSIEQPTAKKVHALWARFGEPVSFLIPRSEW